MTARLVEKFKNIEVQMFWVDIKNAMKIFSTTGLEKWEREVKIYWSSNFCENCKSAIKISSTYAEGGGMGSKNIEVLIFCVDLKNAIKIYSTIKRQEWGMEVEKYCSSIFLLIWKVQ